MADKKISALTAASTPLAGTEVLPIVQSGATVKVAVSDLTAGRAMAASSLTTATVQATNSGGLALKNSGGTTQMLLGGGGGDTITLSVATNITPANAAVAISPTGTGTVTLNPAGASTINNMSIGATTASTGRFTSVTATTGSFVVGTAGQGITDSTSALTSTYNSTGITTNGTNSAGQVYRSGTYTQGDTTPTVLGVSYMAISNSGATSITNFTNAVNGQIITLLFTDSNTTVTRNNAYLLAGLNFTSTANDTLTLIYVSGSSSWYEVCRSLNA
jgi:hypothetical protein